MSSLVAADETIDVPSVGDRGPRKMARRILCDIIEPRVEEILGLVAREIQSCGWEERLTSGLVITGGSSLIPGFEEMAEEVLGVLVRRGEPRNIGGMTDSVKGPQFATAVGLAQYGMEKQKSSGSIWGAPRRGSSDGCNAGRQRSSRHTMGRGAQAAGAAERPKERRAAKAALERADER